MTQTRASPAAAQGAWSALQAFAQTSALQNQALVAIRRPENRKNRVQLVKSGYFAKPYHSWERGLNEHTNGLFRQYFPKGSDLSILSDTDVQRVEDKLNSRPRKILGYQTPREVFFNAKNLLVALHS